MRTVWGAGSIATAGCCWALGLWLAGLQLSGPARAGDAPRAADWWDAGDKACPTGGRVEGRPPPRGNEVACVAGPKRGMKWNGRRTLWFPDKRQRRLEGEYRQGIEHGHFVFWRKDGSKGLEGDYWAGKRSGVWVTWGADGKSTRLEYPDLSTTQRDVDAAIAAALDAAGAVGRQDLGARLDRAADDLRATEGDSSGGAASRGGVPAPVITGAVVVGRSDVADLPDADLGGADFDGEESEADALVRQAVAKATPSISRCYERARTERPELAGEIVARYMIEPDGKVTEVRLVKTSMTEAMNACVKKVLAELRFPARDAAVRSEMISPWRFEPPSGS